MANQNVANLSRRTPAAPGRGGQVNGLEARLLRGGMLVVVLGFWLPALAWGYLTDEHLTAWVTQDGLLDVIGRSHEHQGNSPVYYSLIWLVRQLFGDSAVVLRLPSVLAVLAAAYHLTRLGEELDHRDTGLIAAFVLIANGGVFIRAITARAYGFMLLLLVLSVRFLFRYLRTGQFRHGVTWVLLGVGSLYMTPFAAVMLSAHLFAVWDARRAGSSTARDLPKLMVIAVVAALPLLPQTLDLVLRSGSLAFSTQPSIGTALGYVFPSIVVMAALAGFVVGGTGARLSHRDTGFRFAVAWMVVPIVVLFLMGVVGSPVASVTRYRLGAIPGAGLVAGMVIGRLRRPLGYLTAVTLLVVVSLLQLVHHTGERQGWREATEWAMEETSGEESIMAFDFSLIEQFDVDQVADPAFGSYFTAPAIVYGVDQPVRPLPLGDGPAAQQYLDGLFAELTAYDTIALVTKYASPPPDYHFVFSDRLVDLGYEETTGPHAGLVTAVIFRR